MDKITLEAKGKINILLDVTNRRENGYHDIVTIMQSVNISDTVTAKKNNSGQIVLKTNFDNIVSPEDNIAYKALAMMKEEFSLDAGFKVNIEKRIPIAGGMGGGSTDAAAVIKAVNLLCDLKLSVPEMMKLGLRLGADVPFCIFEKTALAKGVGEELTEIKGLENVYLVIVNPFVSVSTKTIYELVDEKCVLGQIDEKIAIEALEKENINEYPFVLKNIMQSVTQSICPQIEEIIAGLIDLGAVHAMMSGSGPTCFGIFDKEITETVVKERFKDYYVAVTEL